MVSSMGGWIQCWYEELIYMNNGILMECNIITTDDLLDLEVYIYMDSITKSQNLYGTICNIEY